MDVLDYTLRAENQFFDAVDLTDFREKDAQIIYEALRTHIRAIPFCDYLKRYIYKAAQFDCPFEQVEMQEYRFILLESFRENNTPFSFTATTAKPAAICKNWLTQLSVKRQVVFLLGFGLRMSAQDVSDFLTHALRERDFNFKDPFETICWYCFEHGYPFSSFTELTELYNAMPVQDHMIDLDATERYRAGFVGTSDRNDFLRRLEAIKTENRGRQFSVTVGKRFREMYEKVCAIIAGCYSQDARERAEQQAQDYLDRVHDSPVLSPEEKHARAEEIRRRAHVYSPAEITEADAEKFLCCGIPYDRQGNLVRSSASSLAQHFASKRMGRMHIRNILESKSEPTRFDLLTLCFFLCAADEQITDRKTRYLRFADSANEVLTDCGMGELYIANPYECFLLMCSLSEWPMAAYADVLEQSYESGAQ